MAEAIGVRGIGLQDPFGLDQGIADALAHDGPVLVDAVVNRTELAMPPSITFERAKGFTLYMVKAVISGRAESSSNSLAQPPLPERVKVQSRHLYLGRHR